MTHAIIFDWDGTLISCEEKIDHTIRSICQTYPAVGLAYGHSVREQLASPGWVRNGYISSLPEDYFSYHFGILATLLAENQSVALEQAWIMILTAFKEMYGRNPSKLLVEIQGIMELSQLANIYVVSNSETSNIEREASVLGISNAHIQFIGGAKKYKVSGGEQSIAGIPTNRQDYREILRRVKGGHKSLTVVGDNFSMDLVTPISLGINVAYIPNPLTPPAILDYVRRENILSGTVNEIIRTLKTTLK